MAEHLGPTEEALRKHLLDVEHKAWDSLSRYKFQMFGYWAAIWVHLNQIGGFQQPNPWKNLVHIARSQQRKNLVRRSHE